MKEKFEKLPKPLQTQIAIKLIGAAVFLFLFAVILIGFRDFIFSLPCLILSLFLAISGSWLCYNAFEGNYMCLQGVCESIETTGLRKRVKGILIRLENSSVVKVPVRQGMKMLRAGDTVIIYLSDQVPVYEHEGGYMISSYYALDMKKER